MTLLVAIVAGTVAILLTLRHIIRKLNKLMTDQEKLDADVLALGTAFTGVTAEISDLKAQAAAAQPPVPLDFSKLDAAVAQFAGLVPIPAGTSSTPGDGGAVF